MDGAVTVNIFICHRGDETYSQLHEISAHLNFRATVYLMPQSLLIRHKRLDFKVRYRFELEGVPPIYQKFLAQRISAPKWLQYFNG